MGYTYHPEKSEPFLIADAGDKKMEAAIELLEYISDAFKGKYNKTLFVAFRSKKEAPACVAALENAVSEIQAGERANARDEMRELPVDREVFFIDLRTYLSKFKLPDSD